MAIESASDSEVDPAPMKATRRPRSQVSEDQSRSAVHIPDFAKPHLFTRLVPTVIEYFGVKADPWNAQELGRDELLN